MRLGLWGARADNGGLGAQTWEYFKHLDFAKVAVIDISEHNGYKQFPERYPGDHVTFIKGFPKQHQIDIWLEDLDVVFMVESPYNYYIIDAARQRGIKTAIQYNFEFMDWMASARYPKPDLFIAPSLWRYEDVPFENKIYLPVPINTDLLPFKLREQARHFVHVAGHSAFEDRNGTEIVLASLQHITQDVKVTILTQDNIGYYGLSTPANVNIEVINHDVTNYWELLQQDNYDCLLLPRRYGGLSLQLNEALSLGIVPVMPAITPQTAFLSPYSLIPVYESKDIYTRMPIVCYSVNPANLAREIDRLALNPDTVRYLSSYSGELAYEWSWDRLKDEYVDVFEQLYAESN